MQPTATGIPGGRRRQAALGAAFVGLWLAASCAVAQTPAGQGDMAGRQAQARQEREALRERIAGVQRDIDASTASLRDARSALRETEKAISGIRQTLVELAAQEDAERQTLTELATQETARRDELAQRQAALADQLRAQHASGLNPWMAWLSGDDPHVVGRDLAYLGYVSRAQAEAVRAVREAMAALGEVQDATRARQAALASLVARTTEQDEALQAQQQERQRVLTSIEEALAEQRREARQLARDDQRLGGLIDRLARELAEQAAAEEAARQAALRRQREAAAAAQAAAQARASAARDAAQAQAAADAAEAKAAADAVRAREAPRTPPAATAAPPAQALREASLPWPVRGEVLGRFGAQRPEGGSWRGIVVRAQAGAAVRVVAAGRVVYADWLAGFGNLLIVDHGQGMLTVYAYNQSLLKQVGDRVRAGDTVAEVGASGGQVDPGLYFEIRRQGAPVNPLLWLSP